MSALPPPAPILWIKYSITISLHPVYDVWNTCWSATFQWSAFHIFFPHFLLLLRTPFLFSFALNSFDRSECEMKNVWIQSFRMKSSSIFVWWLRGQCQCRKMRIKKFFDLMSFRSVVTFNWIRNIVRGENCKHLEFCHESMSQRDIIIVRFDSFAHSKHSNRFNSPVERILFVCYVWFSSSNFNGTSSRVRTEFKLVFNYHVFIAYL